MNLGETNVSDIREILIDQSSLGGKEVPMDLSIVKNGIIEQTIGVTNNTLAGEKEVPVKIIDVNGEVTESSANVTVKTNMVADGDFDFDQAVIYQVITDRYLNGNTANDDPNGKNYDKTAPFTYHGGDFAGLTQKISDLKELGINTIWISPIVENTDIDQNPTIVGGQYSYHGYWTKDFKVLDPHYGNMEEFKKLIDTAHDNGIKIMVDIVINHSGYGTESEFGTMLRTKEQENGDIYTTPSSGLPDFRTEDPVVRAKLIDWQVDWLKNAKTEKGNTIDYFRVDTVKHVENATWKELKTALTKVDPEFKIDRKSTRLNSSH